MMRTPDRIGMTVAVTLIVCASAARAQSVDTSTVEDRARSARLRQMQERVADIDVLLRGGDTDRRAQLDPEPLLRYADQPRLFMDATLWLWTVDDRPVAVGKIEDHRPAGEDPLWLTCLASTSTSLIRVNWSDGREFAARAPGIAWTMVPGGPAPAATESSRLLQMKRIARRFSAEMIREGDRQQMRLLPRQLHRYSDSAGDLLDGAIFTFTANGTNPDVLMFVQAERTPDADAAWQYGIVGMTADAIELQLDDSPVWSKKATDGYGDERFEFYLSVNPDPR